MNLTLFRKRLTAFYSFWIQYKKHLWGNADVILLYNPPVDSPENEGHHLSSNFYSWLFGRDFYDTIVLFNHKVIYFACPKKKVSQLQTLVVPIAESVDARVVINRKKAGNLGLALMDEMICSMRMEMLGSGEVRPIVIGCITGETPKSDLLWSGGNQLKYRSVSVESGIRKLLSHGDCVSVQMEVLSDELEVLLDMAKEGKGEEMEKNCGLVTVDDDDWVVVGEKEKDLPDAASWTGKLSIFKKVQFCAPSVMLIQVRSQIGWKSERYMVCETCCKKGITSSGVYACNL